MPASAVIDTHLLRAIWNVSLLLSLSSIAIITILILRRIISQRKMAKISIRSKKIMHAMFLSANSPVKLTVTSLPKIDKKDYPIIMRSALDILRSLQGENVVHIIEILTLWNILPYLQKVAAHGTRGKRIQALTLLGYFSDDQSLQIPLKHINSKDMYVQIAALRSLAFRNATTHIQTIIDSLKYSNQTNALILADILQRFGEPAVPDLLKLIKLDANIEVKVAAIMTLGTIRSLSAVNSLIEMTSDSNAYICSHSIVALGKIGDKRAADSIVKNLASKKVSVRIQAAKALGKLQVINTMPQLAKSLADKDWWVRFYAAKSIYDFGDKGIAVLKSMGTQNDKSGIIANQVLGEFMGVA